MVYLKQTVEVQKTSKQLGRVHFSQDWQLDIRIFRTQTSNHLDQLRQINNSLPLASTSKLLTSFLLRILRLLSLYSSNSLVIGCLHRPNLNPGPNQEPGHPFHSLVSKMAPWNSIQDPLIGIQCCETEECISQAPGRQLFGFLCIEYPV